MNETSENDDNAVLLPFPDDDNQMKELWELKLRTLQSRAEFATKEQWQCKTKRFFAYDEAETYVTNGKYIIARCPQGQHDAEFIAAANPRMVLQIIRCLQQREKTLEAVIKQNLELNAECARLKDEILNLTTQNLTNQYKLHEFARWFNTLSEEQKESING